MPPKIPTTRPTLIERIVGVAITCTVTGLFVWVCVLAYRDFMK